MDFHTALQNIKLTFTSDNKYLLFRIMRKIYLLFIVLSLASCGYTGERADAEENNSDNTDATSEAQQLTNKELATISLKYYDTIDVHNTDFIIIPIGASRNWSNRSKGFDFNLDGSMKFGYGSSYKGNDYQFFNLLFYNVKRDTSYLLFNQERAIINRVFANVNNQGESASKHIFYVIRDKDYNLDGKLNGKDSNHLFVSNKDGSGLVQLTPNNSQLLNWTIVKKSNIIIAEVLMDANDDKKFTRKANGDQVRLIKIDLDEKRKGQPFLNKTVEKQLKNQFLDLTVKTR